MITTPSANAFKGNLEDNKPRLGLAIKLELLCMLSPLQVIYAQKLSKTQLELLKVDKFNKGWANHDVIQNDMKLIG